MITQERLDKLKVLHEELYMGEFVDTAIDAIPELVKEIERMRATVKNALEEAEKEVTRMDELAAKARAVGISVDHTFSAFEVNRRDTLKRLAVLLGVIV